MAIVDKLLKIVGKDEFQLDRRITTSYIWMLCWRYGWMMVRGRLLSFGHNKIARDIFVGRKVKILEKKYLCIGAKTKLHDGVYIDALSEASGGVFIGSNVVLGRNTRIECTGSLKSLGKGIHIGDRTTFAGNCFFGAAGGIEIGDDVVAGQQIRFHSENHNYLDMDMLIKDQGVTHKGIKVGNNCWIGAGAVFLDGAEIGDGCVVAANAVVTKKFPSNSVIGGIPARVIKNRSGNKGGF